MYDNTNRQRFHYDGSEFEVSWPKGTSRKSLLTACCEFSSRLSNMKVWRGRWYTISILTQLKEFNYLTDFTFEPIMLNIKLTGKLLDESAFKRLDKELKRRSAKGK